MERKAVKWWVLAAIVLLALVVLAAAFWDTLVMRAAPRLVLNSALKELFSQLDHRFSGDPLGVIAGAYDPEGKCTAAVQIQSENPVVGEVTYDMTVQLDGDGRRVLADGTAGSSAGVLDLSAYMDAHFMAIASEDLLGGAYYGITYDTFAQDIRKIPLLNFLVSDALISRWEDSFEELREGLPIGLTALAAIPQADWKTVLMEIAEMPCTVESCTLQLEGGSESGYALDFDVSQQQLARVVSSLIGEPPAQEGSARLTFFLCENAVVRIALVYQTEKGALTVSLNLGQDPAQDILSLDLWEDGETKCRTVTVETRQTGNRFEETWTILTGEGGRRSVTYNWDSATGDMTLTSSVYPEPCHLNLSKMEDGFRLATDDLAALRWALLQEVKPDQADSMCSGTVTVSGGSAIVTPEYKNLDQWSLGDFLVLLEDVGFLMGISVSSIADSA